MKSKLFGSKSDNKAARVGDALDVFEGILIYLSRIYPEIEGQMSNRIKTNLNMTRNVSEAANSRVLDDINQLKNSYFNNGGHEIGFLRNIEEVEDLYNTYLN